MSRNPAGSPKARNLGAELRSLREAVDVSTRTLAQKLGVARTRLQRWESGTTVPSVEDVAGYLALLGLTHGPERDRLIELSKDVDAGNWTTSDTSGARTELTTLIEFERTCTGMVNVAPLLVPGLLQTDKYIRAVMGDLVDVEKRVRIRLDRQNVLTKRRAPNYHVFISEGVLREPIGGSKVMVEQLRHIIDMAELDNVTIRAIRSGSSMVHPAHAGMFVLFRFAKASPIVHLEHYGPPSFLYNTKDVSMYERAEEELRKVAISETETLALIVKIATEMEQEG